MAVYRENPKCDLCGEDISEVHKDLPDLIGDTFSHWDFEGHNRICKVSKAMNSNIKLKSYSWNFVTNPPILTYQVRYNIESDVWNVISTKKRMVVYVKHRTEDVNEMSARDILIDFLSK